MTSHSTTGVVPFGAHVELTTLRAAANATSPIWRRCRSASGYFVVEYDGVACSAARSTDEGLKNAFCRWIEVGAPSATCSWDEIVDGRITFVAMPGDRTDGLQTGLLP